LRRFKPIGSVDEFGLCAQSADWPFGIEMLTYPICFAMFCFACTFCIVSARDDAGIAARFASGSQGGPLERRDAGLRMNNVRCMPFFANARPRAAFDIRYFSTSIRLFKLLNTSMRYCHRILHASDETQQNYGLAVARCDAIPSQRRRESNGDLVGAKGCWRVIPKLALRPLLLLGA
jgi:hypothetical protein